MCFDNMGDIRNERLIFSCSGAADVGEVSDKLARLLVKQGKGTMCCLAGLGG